MKRYTAVSALVVCLSFVSLSTHAQGLSSFVLKSAFVYNFVTFTQWPQADTINICIYRNSFYAPLLGQILEKKPVANKRIDIHELNSLSNTPQCEVLVIGDLSEGDTEILSDTSKIDNTLIILDREFGNFRQGTITLRKDESRVTFFVNRTLLERQRFKISSKLLRLSRSAPQ